MISLDDFLSLVQYSEATVPV